MSMVAFALRTCTVLALRGATLAGTAVYDSPVDPTDVARKAATPSIFVYSDSEHLEDVDTRDLLQGRRTVDMSVLIVLPAQFQATVGDTTVEFQDRKAGAAAAIDIIYRQVERALIAEETTWSGLWCRLVAKVASLTSHAYILPVGTGAQAHHLPARGISLSVVPLTSPEIGAPHQEFWADFVAALATDPGYAPLAPVIAAAIEGTALPDWRVDALELGDTVEDAIAMGYGPLGGEATDTIVPMAQVTVREAGPNGTEVDFVIAPAEPGAP